jgi:hypothetical protein
VNNSKVKYIGEAGSSQKKWRGLMPKEDLLLHHNARPHSAAATFEATRQLKFYLLPRPHIVRTSRRGPDGGG